MLLLPLPFAIIVSFLKLEGSDIDVNCFETKEKLGREALIRNRWWVGFTVCRRRLCASVSFYIGVCMCVRSYEIKTESSLI